MRSRADEGQVTVLVLGLALLAFAVAGLAVDGTKAWILRRGLQNAADAAALAGAGELDRVGYYRSGGADVALDPDASRRVARTFLARRGLDVRSSVTATEARVVVALHGEVSTTFLRLIGIDRLAVAAVADAAPRETP